MSYKKPRRIIIASNHWKDIPTSVHKVSSALLYDLDDYYELRLFLEGIEATELSVFLQGVSIKVYKDSSDEQLASSLLFCFLLPDNVLYHHIIVFTTDYGICVRMPKADKLINAKAIRLPIEHVKINSAGPI